MSAVSADHRPDTAPATSYYTLSTRQECTALAQAITIRARVKLAQAYASLYEGWVAEDQAIRQVTKAAAVKSSPRSKTSSLLIGALIGLLLGAIAAIVVDARH